MHLANFHQFTCSLCGVVYPAQGGFRYCCEACGDCGLLCVGYDYQARSESIRQLKNDHHTRGLARYASILPIRDAHSLPPLQVGSTPLTPAPRLGMEHLYMKEDNRNPTASFKDRASAVVVAAARDMGQARITTASTGNAASALAGLAAAVGIECVIFVPATAPEAKVTQLLIYGARVMLVEGTYDDAFELSLEATRRFGWFNRNTGYNPINLEGKKTVSLEIWEDLGYRAPDAVFVSVGDGCIIGGVGKGFLDLYRMGLIDRLPRLYGVQAEGSSVLSKAFDSGKVVAEPGAHTYADSICVGEPRAASLALSRVRESKGRFIVVKDEAIRDSQLRLARCTGIFAEPAGAAALTGVDEALRQGWIDKDETVVAICTGHGLKDIKGAMAAVDVFPQRIPKDPSKLADHLHRANLV